MSSTPGRDDTDTYISPSSHSTSASQFPFPRVDSPHRQSPASKLRIRTGSTASSIHSVGGVLDTGPGGHVSVTESGRNAISTLLQAPIVRTGFLPHSAPLGGGFKAPTTRDIPPVTLTNIPHVEAKAFHSYLSQVGSLYDAFQRAKEGADTASQLFRRESVNDGTDKLEALLSPRSERPSVSRSQSRTSVAGSPLESPQTRRRSSAQRRTHAVAPLTTIPKVYFEEDFHLENPRTFDIVSERSEVVRQPAQNGDTAPSGRKALATNAILQEKLSWYMDTVEIHLISSISTASKSFFSALGALRGLHSEAADSVKRIQTLRQDLQKLDRDMALGGLKVVNLKQRRENVRKLGDAVAQLQHIVGAVKELEGKVESGELEAAMDDLDHVERLMSGRSSRGQQPGNDLRGIKALDGITADLNQLQTRIGKGYEARFLETLIGDIHRHVAEVPANVTLERWGSTFARNRGLRKGPGTFPAFNIVQDEFRAQLRSELNGLGRTQSTTAAATAFKSNVLREMKSMIRKQLPNSTDDDNDSMISTSTRGGKQLTQQEKSSILARNLRALDGEDAHKMFERIYVGVSESLRRLSMQVKVLLDITSGLASPPGTAGMRSPPRSPNLSGMDAIVKDGSKSLPTIGPETMQEILDLSGLLGEAVDIVQSQVTKVIKVRSEQTSKLSLVEFLRFFSLNRLFADECEAISGRSGMSLKTAVDSQIKEFVSQFAERRRQQMISIMDADKWDAKDFGEKENVMLNRVLEGSTKDDPLWSETTMIWLSGSENANDTNGVFTNGNVNGKDKIRGASIDEQRYILSESALVMLAVIDQFQHIATGLPNMNPEIASHLLECLKIFNSRSSQLILGAGATRSAGLRNITTKHLALASQALSFIIALVPYLREFFRRHLPSNSSLLGEFDKVKRLFQEHQLGINEKLVEIMSSRATVHVNAMRRINWEDAGNSTLAVNPYMETLAKETGTLHKVLAKHLPEMVVSSIMYPVFSSYRSQLAKAFLEVEIKSESGRQRLLADAEYLSARIGKIDGATDVCQQLVGIAETRRLAAGQQRSEPPSRPVENAPASVSTNGEPQRDEKQALESAPKADETRT